MATSVLLLLSVWLSAGRNILSKKVAAGSGEKQQFYLSQGILFLAAALLMASTQPTTFTPIAPLTLLLGVSYGILLISSQWMYTLALKSGDTSLCAVIYSLGFILPTLFGSLFQGESFTLADGVGLVLAVACIFLTGKKPSSTQEKSNRYFPFLLTAMLSSGGLGILQKVQQASSVAAQKGAFLLIAFTLACAVSFIAYFASRQPAKACKGILLYAAGTGLCFGGANLCNTILAGRLRSAVFFPVQNISTILVSVLLGMLCFREKLSWRTAVVILLGIGTVLLFTL